MTSKKGTDRELYIAHKFSKEGYTTMRSYASIGSFDFIAFRKAHFCRDATHDRPHAEILLIQVKGDPWDSLFTQEQKQLLLDDAQKAGARPVLVYRETRKNKLGLTKKGKQRTLARWETVYL